MCFIWHRIHRGLFWEKYGDIYSVNVNQLRKLEGVYERVSAYLAEECPGKNIAKFVILCLKRNYSMASMLVENINLPDDIYLSYFFKGIKSFRYYLNRYVDYNDYSVSIDVAKDKRHDAVILLSCDINYYNKFHDCFLRSLRTIGLGNTVVFVVVDCSDNFYNEIDNFYKIGVDLDIDSSPALYASARYIFAHKIMDIFNRDIFIFDIDFDFRKTNPLSINCRMEVDIGLSFNKYGRTYFPWAHISAAACYLSNNKISKFFLNKFRDYFFENYSKYNWWIDQNSLFYAYLSTRDVFPTMLVKNLIDLRDLGVSNSEKDVINFKRNINSR